MTRLEVLEKELSTLQESSKRISNMFGAQYVPQEILSEIDKVNTSIAAARKEAEDAAKINHILNNVMTASGMESRKNSIWNPAHYNDVDFYYGTSTSGTYQTASIKLVWDLDDEIHQAYTVTAFKINVTEKTYDLGDIDTILKAVADQLSSDQDAKWYNTAAIKYSVDTIEAVLNKQGYKRREAESRQITVS